MRAQGTFLGLVFLIIGASTSGAVTATQSEHAQAAAWATSALSDAASPLAFASFRVGGTPFRDLVATRKVERSERSLDANQTARTISYTDPASGLEVRYEAVTFADFPVIEWVLYFRNPGTLDSPIIEDVLPLDLGFPLTRDRAARVHHANGSECRLDDFQPHVTSLGPNEHDPQGAWLGEGNPLRVESKGGRSSCGALPFFNLEMAGGGAMLAVGWTGDWGASFYRTDTEVRARAGMKRTHFKLLPGEEVRSPRIMVMFYEGEARRGHNLLRQFILAHHTPTVNGAPAKPPVANATWGGNYAEKHIEHGLWWKQNNLPLDYLWIDAGWFGEDEAKVGATVFNSGWGRFVGDWKPNSGYFPEGLKPVSDALKDAGLGLLLWLEPERVYKETTWTREHPEFLLGPIGDNSLFNLGNPEARQFLTDSLGALIAENDIGCYRQDFNMDPRPFWDAADTPDRLGISEMKHIAGMYRMWDELRERFPNLLIDNCSSGGRRIDLESISRSMPLWRSDVQCWPNFGATAMQGQTHGLGMWVPFSTGACDREDTYVFRSALGPGMVLIMYEFEQDVAKHFNVDWMRVRLAELNTVRPYFEGDFYPLLSYSLVDDAWAAWQFDRPDTRNGAVIALRRPASPFHAMRPTLHALKPEATYEFQNVDTGEIARTTGAEAMETGLEISIGEKPGSALWMYKVVQ